MIFFRLDREGECRVDVAGAMIGRMSAGVCGDCGPHIRSENCRLLLLWSFTRHFSFRTSERRVCHALRHRIDKNSTIWLYSHVKPIVTSSWGRGRLSTCNCSRHRRREQRSPEDLATSRETWHGSPCVCLYADTTHLVPALGHPLLYLHLGPMRRDGSNRTERCSTCVTPHYNVPVVILATGSLPLGANARLCTGMADRSRCTGMADRSRPPNTHVSWCCARCSPPQPDFVPFTWRLRVRHILVESCLSTLLALWVVSVFNGDSSLRYNQRDVWSAGEELDFNSSIKTWLQTRVAELGVLRHQLASLGVTWPWTNDSPSPWRRSSVTLACVRDTVKNVTHRRTGEERQGLDGVRFGRVACWCVLTVGFACFRASSLVPEKRK